MRRALTYTVREVVPYINWIYYFHAWGMGPRFATIADIHDCPSCRAGWIASFHMSERAKAQEAVKLYQEAAHSAEVHGQLPRGGCQPDSRILILVSRNPRSFNFK